MEKITINGEELTIKFNFATELSYEELTGKAFDASEILPKDQTPNSKDVIKLALACVIANNPDAKTDSDYILHDATREEVSLLVSTVIREMLVWLGVPAMAESHIPDASPSDEEGEGERPNA